MEWPPRPPAPARSGRTTWAEPYPSKLKVTNTLDLDDIVVDTQLPGFIEVSGSIFRFR